MAVVVSLTEAEIRAADANERNAVDVVSALSYCLHQAPSGGELPHDYQSSCASEHDDPCRMLSSRFHTRLDEESLNPAGHPISVLQQRNDLITRPDDQAVARHRVAR